MSSTQPPAKKAKTQAEKPPVQYKEDLTFSHPSNDIVLRSGVETDPSHGRIAYEFPYRSSILANAIDIYDSMFAQIKDSPDKTITLENVPSGTLRTFLHLLSPSQAHPITVTLAALRLNDLLDLFRLVHRYEVNWILAEIGNRLFCATSSSQSGRSSSTTGSGGPVLSQADLQTLFSFAFFLRPEPMYALAAHTLSLFSYPFSLTSFPRETRGRLMDEQRAFYLIAEDFYSKDGKLDKERTRFASRGDEKWTYSTDGYQTKADIRRDKAAATTAAAAAAAGTGTRSSVQKSSSRRARTRLSAWNVARMFEEARLDCDKLVFGDIKHAQWYASAGHPSAVNDSSDDPDSDY